MTGRDDPYLRDDPYQDGPEEAPHPRRHATRPARPAWDAMTYGRPDDARRPLRTPEPDAPYGSRSEPPYGSRASSAGRDPDWTDRYGPPPAPPTPPSAPATSYPAAVPSYPAAAPTYPAAPSYPAATPSSPAETPSYPASVYPAATDAYTPPPSPESFAPESYTSYRAASAPEGPSPADEAEPVYVASGLYLDEPTPASPERRDGPPGGQPSGEAYPGGQDASPAPPPQKGGRNLPAAVGVGVGLGAVVLGSLFFWRPAFLGVVLLGVGAGIWELVRALQRIGANPPLVPLLAGGILMTGLAWWGGPDGLTFGLVVTVVAVMVWRFAHGTTGYGTDVTMAALVAVYVPFLGGFAAMLARPEDGHLRVLAMLIAVVLSDTGGYVVGAKFGRHPLAPSISPKKSWEGLGGSLGAAAVGSSIVLSLMFGASLWWWGLLFGLAVALASIVGDLGESMVKRAIGIKDMSGLLPGHGGAMDRLDSILFAAPVGYVLLSVIVPVS